MNRNAPFFKASADALINWNGMNPAEVDQIIQTESIEQIQQRTTARGSVHAAAFRMASELNQMLDLGLSYSQIHEFTQEVMGLTDSREMSDLLQEKIQEHIARNPEQAMLDFANIALDACDSVHSNWTFENAKEFFGRKTMKEQLYQYGPSEVIGWGEVKSDLLFLKPVSDSIQMPVDPELMRELYVQRVADYFKHIQEIGGPGIEGVGGPGIDTIREVIDVVDNLENGVRINLSPEVRDMWEHNPELVNAIAQQVSSKGIGRDEGLIEMLQDQGILSHEDPVGFEIT